MRVRALDQNGDMTFGQSSQNFLVNSPEAVAQCCITALKLSRGDWFLDTTAGVPWKTQVLGFGTAALYDTAIRTAILGVEGVTAITAYQSSLNKTTRQLSVTASISTPYGAATFSLQLSPPLLSGYGVGGYGENPYGE